MGILQQDTQRESGATNTRTFNKKLKIHSQGKRAIRRNACAAALSALFVISHLYSVTAKRSVGDAHCANSEGSYLYRTFVNLVHHQTPAKKAAVSQHYEEEGNAEEHREQRRSPTQQMMHLPGSTSGTLPCSTKCSSKPITSPFCGKRLLLNLENSRVSVPASSTNVTSNAPRRGSVGFPTTDTFLWTAVISRFT